MGHVSEYSYLFTRVSFEEKLAACAAPCGSATWPPSGAERSRHQPSTTLDYLESLVEPRRPLLGKASLDAPGVKLLLEAWVWHVLEPPRKVAQLSPSAWLLGR